MLPASQPVTASTHFAKQGACMHTHACMQCMHATKPLLQGRAHTPPDTPQPQPVAHLPGMLPRLHPLAGVSKAVLSDQIHHAATGSTAAVSAIQETVSRRMANVHDAVPLTHGSSQGPSNRQACAEGLTRVTHSSASSRAIDTRWVYSRRDMGHPWACRQGRQGKAKQERAIGSRQKGPACIRTPNIATPLAGNTPQTLQKQAASPPALPGRGRPSSRGPAAGCSSSPGHQKGTWHPSP